MLVMLVSFLEAFLEDILIAIASKNPRILKGEGVPVRAVVTADFDSKN